MTFFHAARTGWTPWFHGFPCVSALAGLRTATRLEIADDSPMTKTNIDGPSVRAFVDVRGRDLNAMVTALRRGVPGAVG